MGFDIKNISSGMWKFVIFVGVIIFVIIILTNSPPSSYAYAIAGMIGLIIILGISGNPEMVRIRTLAEAMVIADEYLKKKIEMQIQDFNVELPKGELNYDGNYLHDWKEGLEKPEWEIGFHIHPTYQSFTEYYSLLIHGLNEPLTIKGLRQLKSQFFATPYKTKYLLVDFTDSRKFHQAMYVSTQHNRAEGFDDEKI